MFVQTQLHRHHHHHHHHHPHQHRASSQLATGSVQSTSTASGGSLSGQPIAERSKSAQKSSLNSTRSLPNSRAGRVGVKQRASSLRRADEPTILTNSATLKATRKSNIEKAQLDSIVASNVDLVAKFVHKYAKVSTENESSVTKERLHKNSKLSKQSRLRSRSSECLVVREKCCEKVVASGHDRKLNLIVTAESPEYSSSNLNTNPKSSTSMRPQKLLERQHSISEIGGVVDGTSSNLVAASCVYYRRASKLIENGRQTNDPLSQQQSTSRRLTFLTDYSRKNLHFISSFFRSFIDYQLETWRLLVDSSTMNHALHRDSNCSSFNDWTDHCSVSASNNTRMGIAPSPKRQDQQRPSTPYQINGYHSGSTKHSLASHCLRGPMRPQSACVTDYPNKKHLVTPTKSLPSNNCLIKQYTAVLLDCKTDASPTTHAHSISPTQQQPHHWMPNNNNCRHGPALTTSISRGPKQTHQHHMACESNSLRSYQYQQAPKPTRDHHHLLTHSSRAMQKLILGSTNSSPALLSVDGSPVPSECMNSIRSDRATSVNTNFTSNSTSSLDYSAEDQSTSLSLMDGSYENNYWPVPLSHSLQAAQSNHQYTTNWSPMSVSSTGVNCTDRAATHQQRDSQRPSTTGSDSELYTNSVTNLHPNHQHTSTKNDQYQDDRADRAESRGDDTNAESSNAPPNTERKLSGSTATSPSSDMQSSAHRKLLSSASFVSQQKSPNKSSTIKKANKSTSRVSLAGARRRLGFKQKGLSSLSVQRSEEILPPEVGDNPTLSDSMSSTGSGNDFSFRWINQLKSIRLSGDPNVCFVDGLGIGQIASRQALVSPYMGDVQLSLSDQRGMFEVEVVRLRCLQSKAGAKRLPSPYVKVYLMKDRKCVAKFKTGQAKRVLDPLYQQRFIYRDDYTDCVLQVIVWGDYGKRDRKSLMGIVQVHLNDVDMSNTVVGWYRLFNAPAMVANCAMLSSKMLRKTLSSTNLGQEMTTEPQ